MRKMLTTRKLKQNSLLVISLLFLAFAILGPIAQTFASDEDVVKEAANAYKGDTKNASEMLGKLSSEGKIKREDTFSYIFSRIASPQYINDVPRAVTGGDGDKSLINNDGSTCSSSDPFNLINANCDIPNFSAQLGQSVMRILSPNGITGGERKPAKSMLSWGVPDGIPNGSVPVNEDERTNKYTGLELFGYNLGYTNYNGEWDDVIPSTKARLLANFGLMDTINLAGSSIWEGAKSGLGSLVDGLSWNPSTWLGNVSKSFESAGSASLITIMDTSDANVVTTRAWTRAPNSVANSFYGVKVLTDKEVMESATAKVGSLFSQRMNEEVANDPELQEVMSLQVPPAFTFDPNRETEKSKQDRADAESKNAEIDKQNGQIDAENQAITERNNAKDPEEEKEKQKPHIDKVKVPEKVIMTEEDQFAEFKKNDGQVQRGEKAGITCSAETNYSGYKACWATKWEDLKKEKFNGKSSLIEGLQKKVTENLIQSLPTSDPSKAISHYVCADADGKAILNQDGSYKYVYSTYNAGSTENLTPGCPIIRPTVKGGYFGTGDATEITDTRHISNIPSKSWTSFIPVIGDINAFISSVATFITRFVAQTLNELLNLSFSPLMDKLGITIIVKSSINSFKNTIFFPLISLAVMFGSFMMIVDVLKTRNATKFLTSIGAMVLVFFLGIVLLNSPDKIVDALDSGPAKIEQYVLGLLINNDSNDGLCTTDSSTSNHGVRSAQCNIWRTLDYQPWLFGQWGTSDSNLNAKGFAKDGKSELKNTNEKLVGNAPVNLGAGTTLNNWALYQLKLTTSGTITTDDSKNPVGKTDNNLYKIVDAQAGPNNAKGRDTSYFMNWTGAQSHRTSIALMSLIQSVFMLIVIGSLLLVKIEMTFIFSIMLIGLPFVLLFGVTPKGKTKLLGYCGTMFSLLMKRFMAVFLISLLLELMNVVVPKEASSYLIVFLASMIVMGFFQAYKKEILNLLKLSSSNAFSGDGLLSGDPDQIRDAVRGTIPLSLKNRLSISGGKLKGAAEGIAGGALGGALAGLQLKATDENNKFIKRTPSRMISDIARSAKNGASMSTVNGASREENRNKRKNEKEIESCLKKNASRIRSLKT